MTTSERVDPDEHGSAHNVTRHGMERQVLVRARSGKVATELVLEQGDLESILVAGSGVGATTKACRDSVEGQVLLGLEECDARLDAPSSVLGDRHLGPVHGDGDHVGHGERLAIDADDGI